MERLSRYGKTILFLAVLTGIWQALAVAGPWPAYLFPTPAGVVGSMGEGIRNGSFAHGIAVSLKRLLIGFLLSILAGTAIGFLIGRVRAAEDTIGVLVLGLQTLPSICWLPIAILWFGLNERAVIFVVIMGALLSIAIAVSDGVKNIPPVYVRAARTMGAHGVGLYVDVLAPAALPALVTGAKLGWSFAWRSLMAGELLFLSGGGLGFLLQSGREFNDISRVAAVMVVIVAIGLAFDRLAFRPLERRVRQRWGLG